MTNGTKENNWGRDTLVLQIKSDLYFITNDWLKKAGYLFLLDYHKKLQSRHQVSKKPPYTKLYVYGGAGGLVTN